MYLISEACPTPETDGAGRMTSSVSKYDFVSARTGNVDKKNRL
ncbi:MAG TPA: hypothetical protein VJH96_01010 [Patescibacteria group bacterium]|nr:hypothetical protein [Patescibacteria group bacterium]